MVLLSFTLVRNTRVLLGGSRSTLLLTWVETMIRFVFLVCVTLVMWLDRVPLWVVLLLVMP